MALKRWHRVVIAMLAAMGYAAFTILSPLSEDTRVAIAAIGAFAFPILFIFIMRN